MKKRRIEMAVLAALIVFAAADRPSLVDASVDLAPDLYQVGEFAPQHVATMQDLGMIAVKLLATWIG